MNNLGYMESFDCQEQCEEMYTREGFRETVGRIYRGEAKVASISSFWEFILGNDGEVASEFDSEDILDRCEVISLETLKQGAAAGAYRMEEIIEEAMEFDELWDSHEDHDRMWEKFEARRVGC